MSQFSAAVHSRHSLNAAVQFLVPHACLRLDTRADNVAHDTADSCTRNVAVALKIPCPRLDEVALRLVGVLRILVDRHPAVIKPRDLACLVCAQTLSVKGTLTRPLRRDCRDCLLQKRNHIRPICAKERSPPSRRAIAAIRLFSRA